MYSGLESPRTEMCMTSTDTAQIITTAQTKSIFPAPTTKPHEVVCGEKES